MFWQNNPRLFMSNKPIDMYKIRQLLKLYASGRGSKFISNSTGIARNTVKKYLLQFVSLRLTMTDIEAMSDAQMANAFLMEKPRTENPRIVDLELLLPALAARLKKEALPRRCFISSISTSIRMDLNILLSWNA